MKPTTNLKPRGPSDSVHKRGRTTGWALMFLGVISLPFSAVAAPRELLDREDARSSAKLSSEFRVAHTQGSSQVVKIIIQYKQPVLNTMAAPGEREMRAQGATVHARL